jgi:hypothetical protein
MFLLQKHNDQMFRSLTIEIFFNKKNTLLTTSVELYCKFTNGPANLMVDSNFFLRRFMFYFLLILLNLQSTNLFQITLNINFELTCLHCRFIWIEFSFVFVQKIKLREDDWNDWHLPKHYLIY